MAVPVPVCYPRAQYLVYLRFLAVALPLLIIAGGVCGISASELRAGFSRGARVIGFFFPPDWSALPEMLEASVTTLLLAFLGTIPGAAISFLLALGGSRNLAPAWLRPVCRGIVTVERGVPEIATVIVVAAAFGMGPLPGAIALAIGSIGMLGRLMADAMEGVEERVVESVRAVGATLGQGIRYAILPEAGAALVAAAVFRFEINVRASVLIGAIGAGGLGYEINSSMQSFDYRRACAAIGTTLAVVFLTELASTQLRKRILRKPIV